MPTHKRKFCSLLSIHSYCIGSGMNARELEKLTLLGIPTKVREKCLFCKEEEVVTFLESIGLSPSSLHMTEHSRKKEGYVMKELVCPKPFGNTFLLQYHWYGTFG